MNLANLFMFMSQKESQLKIQPKYGLQNPVDA